MGAHPDSWLPVGNALGRHQLAYSEHDASLEGTTKAAITMTYESCSEEPENLGGKKSAPIKKRDKKAESKSEARREKLGQPD